MFTGIIEQQGIVAVIHKVDHALRLVVEAACEALEVGESIAINGVCLTALAESTLTHLVFDVSSETLRVTNLGRLAKGEPVNVERAMLANARFGGHYVSGHIDATAYITQYRSQDNYVELTISQFSVSPSLFILPKGSITLDGVSLTINHISEDQVTVMLIPHTLKHTTFGTKQIGACINVEFDYLTRVVAHQLRHIYDKSI